jgi:hypothetical protein
LIQNTSKKSIIFIFGLLFAILLVQIKIDFLNFFIYDQFFRIRPFIPTSGLVSTIIIDKDTEKRLGHSPDAVDYLKFINRLNALQIKPKHLIFVSALSEVTGSESQKKILADELLKFSPVIQLTQQTSYSEGEKDFRLPSPYEKIIVKSAPKTKDENTC